MFESINQQFLHLLSIAESLVFQFVWIHLPCLACGQRMLFISLRLIQKLLSCFDFLKSEMVHWFCC